MTLIRAETAHAINGVNGRLHNLHIPPLPWVDGVFANQKWVSVARPVKGYGKNGMMTVEMRFDDNCKNGRMSFAITAVVVTDESRRRRDIAAGGCMHDEIAEVFPELAPLTKWHLCYTDGPMHYPGNVLYLAGDRDCWGRAKGEPSSFAHGLRFGNSPIFYKLKRDNFRKWLIAAEDFNAKALKTNPAYIKFEPVAVPYTGDGTYKFGPKFTFKGYDVKWHDCPFDSEREALEFAEALRLPHEFVKLPTAWSEGKARELDGARRSAIWPEATDEQLSLPRAELEALLMARLPELLDVFRMTMERIGFLWEAPKRG